MSHTLLEPWILDNGILKGYSVDSFIAPSVAGLKPNGTVPRFIQVIVIMVLAN